MKIWKKYLFEYLEKHSKRIYHNGKEMKVYTKNDIIKALQYSKRKYENEENN